MLPQDPQHARGPARRRSPAAPGRGRVTAAELAKELEVAVVTARRDLEALSSAGVPVYPQPGRGGGRQLVGGARTDLSGLSAPEAQVRRTAVVGPFSLPARRERSSGTAMTGPGCIRLTRD